MKNIKTYIIYAAIGITGILIGSLLFGGNNQPQTLDQHISETHTDEEGNVVYTCSMHPSVRQNEPGNCPICGMELIPANDTQSASNPNSMVMSQAAMKLAEIETTPVRIGNPVATIRLPGKVKVDQEKTSAVTAHIPGRIIDLYVDFEGDFVRKGDKLASIYSPKLLAAQQELLETIRFKEQNPVLYNAAKRKLKLLEVPSKVINEIEEKKEVMRTIDIVSPADGFITEIMVNRQEHVVEGAVMYQIADLSSVWVIFNSFEADLSIFETGQNLSFTTTSYPGETFTGSVNYLYPTIDQNSRSMDIRVEVENPDYRLKPNMLAEGVVEAPVSSGTSLLVPKTAVLWTGTRSVVFVREKGTQEPTFTAREITLGKQVGDYYVVKEGLKAGDEVVTNGTFKLDSAAQLADKLSMMNREPGTGANRTGHEGHTMDQMGEAGSEMEIIKTQAITDLQQDSIPAAFIKQIQTVVKNYLDVKNALVASDSKEASVASGEILKALQNVDMSLVKGDLHEQWMDYLNNLTRYTEIIGKSDNLKMQRNTFIQLSDNMINTVKTFEIPGVIYEQFCTMANSGEGASWLSMESTVANPYYGDMMHNCGEIVTRIEF